LKLGYVDKIGFFVGVVCSLIFSLVFLNVSFTVLEEQKVHTASKNLRAVWEDCAECY